MSAGFPYFVDARERLHDLRAKWGWLLALGIVLIAVGTAAISYPVVATMTTVTFLGVMLLFAAGAQVASAIWARRWGGFLLHLLAGLLYGFVGVVMLERPALGAEVYTLMMAVFFVAGGLVRIVMSFSQKFSGWGWLLVSGAISVLMGILIWRQYPASALWVVGTFVGIDLLFLGWSWVMLALAVRNAPPDAV